MHHLIQILRDVDEFEALAGLVTDRLEIHLQGRCLRANLRNGERLLSRCSFHPQESLLALRVGHLIQMPKNSASCTVCIIAGCSKARPSLRCALEVEMTPEDQFGHQMSVEPVTGRMPCLDFFIVSKRGKKLEALACLSACGKVALPKQVLPCLSIRRCLRAHCAARFLGS